MRKPRIALAVAGVILVAIAALWRPLALPGPDEASRQPAQPVSA